MMMASFYYHAYFESMGGFSIEENLLSLEEHIAEYICSW